MHHIIHLRRPAVPGCAAGRSGKLPARTGRSHKRLRCDSHSGHARAEGSCALQLRRGDARRQTTRSCAQDISAQLCRVLRTKMVQLRQGHRQREHRAVRHGNTVWHGTHVPHPRLHIFHRNMRRPVGHRPAQQHTGVERSGDSVQPLGRQRCDRQIRISEVHPVGTVGQVHLRLRIRFGRSRRIDHRRGVRDFPTAHN